MTPGSRKAALQVGLIVGVFLATFFAAVIGLAIVAIWYQSRNPVEVVRLDSYQQTLEPVNGSYSFDARLKSRPGCLTSNARALVRATPDPNHPGEYRIEEQLITNAPFIVGLRPSDINGDSTKLISVQGDENYTYNTYTFRIPTPASLEPGEEWRVALLGETTACGAFWGLIGKHDQIALGPKIDIPKKETSK